MLIWIIIGTFLLFCAVLIVPSFTSQLQVPDQEGSAVLVRPLNQYAENCWLADCLKDGKVITGVVFCDTEHNPGDVVAIGNRMNEYFLLPKFYEKSEEAA